MSPDAPVLDETGTMPRAIHADRAAGEVSAEPTLQAAESEAAAETVTSVVPKFDLVIERGVHTRTVVLSAEPTADQIKEHVAAAEMLFGRMGEADPVLQDRRKPR